MNRFLLFLLLCPAARLGAQSCIAINNCPGGVPDFCDPAPNSPLFWNEPAWSDPNGISDLNEAPADLCLQATGFCPGDVLSFRYLLFLDLNGNGSWETVVNSAALPGYNTVYFGNADNPNYTGGAPRAFDERPVAANQKYGFAIQTTADGNTATACVRWNTQAEPDEYEIPLLPPGRHKIKWFVTNGTGEEKTCEYEFRVKKDCNPPTVVCNNGLIINLLPTTFVTLWAVDFLQYAEDNVTPSNQIQLGLRKTGTGVGFPEDSLGNPIISVTYSCFELGLQPVELWARDEAGNANYCETYVTVEDATGACIGIIGAAEPNPAFHATVPNPFHDFLRIQLYAERPAELSIRLFDPTGRDIFQRRESMATGEKNLEIPTAGLPEGFYFLLLSDEEGTRQLKPVLKTNF